MSNKLRETILNATDLNYEPVDVPEWGGCTIALQGLTARQRSLVVGQVVDGKTDALMIDLVLMGAVDPDTHEPIFDLADRDSLMSKSGAVIDRLATIVLRLSGMAPQALEAAGNA